MTEREDPRTDDPNPGDRSRDEEPHHALNNPADNPDETEWPDPYDKREDPRAPGEGHPPTGATSTSEPAPPQDEEAEYFEGPKRDKVDE
jgi:hypothetical protein